MSAISPECTNAYVISRSVRDDAYAVWRFDPTAPELLTALPLAAGASYPRTDSLVWIGNYFLSWTKVDDTDPDEPFYCYRMFAFDPSSDDPLAAPAIQQGKWLKKKFWGRSADFGNPDGGHEAYDRDDRLTLIPLGTFLLNFIPTLGRGTFALWSFDPAPTEPLRKDPLPGEYPYTPQGSFRDMQLGDQLVPLDGYVLDRKLETGEFALWSFDPQAQIPLAHPAITRGRWPSIDLQHRLLAIGDYVLDWIPTDRSYRLWAFDPTRADPLTGPVREGTLPEGFDGATRLMSMQPNLPAARPDAAPGTIEFMRAKIEHVVYYMLENRSLDHVCGWLYEDGQQGIHFVGPDFPYDGASTQYSNYDPEKRERVHLSKYHDGKLSTDWSLEIFTWDPYHDNSDVLRQLFYEDRDGYAKRAVPDMGGFVWNNGSPAVMETYGPEQLPVLNGLAKSFAISDRWFCSMPSGTDVNRAFSVSGSALMQLDNFMSPPEYFYWPLEPHRASIWKVLWAAGLTDWRIYNSTTWYDKVFTYQLFLEGQIPTVDESVNEGSTQYVAPIDQFYDDALSGNLPRFSFLEPVWVGNDGTTSYHPGEDLVPGERQLDRIYDVLRRSPQWDRTLLVVTFDEHGGIFDHVPPPYAVNPWPNDVNDGFRYDLMGPRVPTILASPWIEEQTVFRSTTGVEYDATSFLATLLRWAGIPRARWLMGERTKHAPTFEGVLTRSEPRRESPTFTPPYDQQYPPNGEPRPSTSVHGLHRMVATRAVWSLLRDELPPAEIRTITHDLLERAKDLPTLRRLLDEIHERFG